MRPVRRTPDPQECDPDGAIRGRLQDYLPDRSVSIQPPSAGYLSPFHVQEVAVIGADVDPNRLAEFDLENDFAAGPLWDAGAILNSALTGSSSPGSSRS